MLWFQISQFKNLIFFFSGGYLSFFPPNWVCYLLPISHFEQFQAKEIFLSVTTYGRNLIWITSDEIRLTSNKFNKKEKNGHNATDLILKSKEKL